MKTIVWFMQYLFTFVGFVATYAPLYADLKGIDMWKIAWQYWAIIGVTLLWLSLVSIIFRLYMENRRFHSQEYRLQIEKLEREVKQLRLDQYTTDTGKLI